MNFYIALDKGIDVVGDIHGCFDELVEGLVKLGYKKNEMNEGYYHPEGRKLLFLGDMMSRGPLSLKVMRLTMDMVKENQAYAIDGNHNWKVARYLMGKKVQMKHGDDRFVKELAEYEKEHGKQKTESFIEEMKEFLLACPSHYIITDQGKKLAVAVHAGIRDSDIGLDKPAIREFTRYGDVAGMAENGKPIRRDWTLHHKNELLIFWGHDPKPEPKLINNTINLDQGCVFGGRLTFFRYPEQEIIQIDAKENYSGETDHAITKYFRG